MAHIVNPHNLDDDDDAVFSALLSEGLIWIEEEDDENRRESEIEYLESTSEIKVHTLKTHKKRVNAIVVSGDFAISASDDKTLCVWNWQTGEHMRTLKGHRSSVNAIVVSGDFAISASDDKTLCVWNWQTGEHMHTLSGYTQQVSSLDIDGEVVASCSSGEVWVWNWQTGQLLQKLTGTHLGVVMSTAIDGDFAVTASPDLLLVRNWKTGENLHTLRLDNHTTNKLVNLGLDNDFAVFNNFYSIDVWNWKTGKHLDESDLRFNENIQINTKAFLISANLCAYNRKTSKWCLYHIDYAYDKVALVEDYSHIIASDHGGWIYVVRINQSLKRVITRNISSSSVATLPNTTKSKPQKKSANSQKAQQKLKVMKEAKPDYNTDDVLQAAYNFMHKRNEGWVNFSQVAQHLYETFYNLEPKRLGQPNKTYKTLLKFFADYSSKFDLRQDDAKNGLYWIRLKRTL